MSTDDVTQEELDLLTSAVDQSFIIAMGIFVYFMQAGFALLEAGSVRAKNVTNILFKNLADATIGGLFYFLCGYAFAFGSTNPFIGDERYFALSALPREDYSFFFYQYVFACTAATIVSGAMAERASFISYLIYSSFVSAFVYPVVSHWVWGGGWLADRKYPVMDYAGSSVVHSVGGTAALCGAALLGPRIGRLGRPPALNMKPIPGHSTTLICLGAFILWIGFLAFNGGSELKVSGGSVYTVGVVIVNTIMANVGGGLTVLAIVYIREKRISLLGSVNGTLAGMVAICAGCNVVEPWAALVIGVVAGATYYVWSNLMLHFKIDDPVDAVAVHLGCGFWGMLARPIFEKDGIIYSFSEAAWKRFGVNLGGELMIIAWTAGLCFPMFYALKRAGILRVDEATELEGLDVKKHGEISYPAESNVVAASARHRSDSTGTGPIGDAAL